MVLGKLLSIMAENKSILHFTVKQYYNQNHNTVKATGFILECIVKTENTGRSCFPSSPPF